MDFSNFLSAIHGIPFLVWSLKKNTIWFSYIQIFLFYTMNKSDIHSFDKDLPTFSTEEPKIERNSY